MFLKIFLLCFFLYVLYRFVFQFLLPVYKTTKDIKKGFREMQAKADEQMKQQARQQQKNSNSASSPAREPEKQSLGEYIDFEEIK